MSMARVVIMAVVVEGRSKSEVGRDYGVSRQWVQRLVARYQVEGEAAFEPRSRRPHSNPHRIAGEVEEAIVALRKQLSEAGFDAGAETIAWHLRQRADAAPPSVAGLSAFLCKRVTGVHCQARSRRPGKMRSNWLSTALQE
jgi:hypothetical protein